jgi:large subunit ribosomal protein L18
MQGFVPLPHGTDGGTLRKTVSMNAQKLKARRATRRQNHVRSKVRGTPERPRLTVFRSSKHIYAQLIDDLNGITLASASTAGKPTTEEEATYGGNVKAAVIVGTKLAEAAKAKGITLVAFDRGPFRFHGRLKALADAARAGGLQF